MRILLKNIKPNPNNPRFIRDNAFKDLLRSVAQFPQMLDKRPIAVTKEGKAFIALGGNQRTRVLTQLQTEINDDAFLSRYETTQEAQNLLIEYFSNGVPAVDCTDLTPDQQRRFINDALANEWDADELKEWGMNLPEWGEGDGGEGSEKEKNAMLMNDFIVPPFSVLDSRQGYWSQRKKEWRDKILDFGESRKGALSGDINMITSINDGVSLLDPVLAEILCFWFGIERGNAFDCFAGDTVFGYVSSKLGMTFTGIELRQEQADFNNKRVEGMSAAYICDDGRNVLNHLSQLSQDFFFSCPPYFDLEVYSSLENDASNQKEYKGFLEILSDAFSSSIKCLKNERFAAVVVGDIRDKSGAYRGFPDDIRSIFKKNGMVFYNEIILVEPLGTLPQRAARYMNNRKVGKCHQNILIFYKGDTKKIKDTFPKIKIPQIDDESADVQ